jgi:pyruvate-ferredoxin/flavodoxin oxidoreductase
MVPREEEQPQEAVWDYMVTSVAQKEELFDLTVKGSQFHQPLLEFSGSCAGCAETSYARLITQVCGDRMYISNATGCSSIWGGPAATSPYTVTKEGRGPAWANSLFEDNAEHGFGMYLGQKAIRERLKTVVEDMAENGKVDAIRAAAKEYLATYNDGRANDAATRKLVELVEKQGCGGNHCQEILKNKEYLSKKSVWIFGGDGWAYDIGFGGLDHVLAQGEDVNVMVFDTEVYSNTGGQASKASQIGQVAQFAAAGKALAKKSLAQIAMTYGYIYVAQIAMGADPAQALKAITEAEAYPGPSLVIGYAPCEMHSIKGGMTNCQSEMKKAVDCGYWNLFRYNPALLAEGKNPFTLDSKAPTGSYRDFIMNEARYSALTINFPQRAEELFTQAEKTAQERFANLELQKQMYAQEAAD